MKTYHDRVGVERCASCSRLATDRPASNDLYAAAVRALRFLENYADGRPNGAHEDLLCAGDLKRALDEIAKERAA